MGIDSKTLNSLFGKYKTDYEPIQKVRWIAIRIDNCQRCYYYKNQIVNKNGVNKCNPKCLKYNKDIDWEVAVNGGFPEWCEEI